MAGVFSLDSVLSIVPFHHVLWGGETKKTLENMVETTKLCSRLRRKLNIRNNYLSLFLKKAKIRKLFIFLFLVT